MSKTEDKETRYYLDLDVSKMKIINLDYDQRENLTKHRFSNPAHHRIFITKGQYNKLQIKLTELK